MSMSRRVVWIVGLTLVWVGSVFAQGVPVTLQWFETSWTTMEDRTADAFLAGYQRVWTPPISKGESGASSVGYDLFDRFDLGSPGSPTRYGTAAGLLAVIAEQDKAGIGTFVDVIYNHNAFADGTTPGFAAAGDYPGFVLSWSGDPDGDFHARWDDCGANPILCRIAGLIDIAQEKNHVMIRHPVTPGDPQNITAGSVYDKPDPANRRFYSDTGLPANSIGLFPFNLADPMAGDPVAENATGLLLRHTRWLLEIVGVDGFRIDAAKHIPDWFFRDFYDRHVWQRGRPTVTGAATTPFSFGEVFDGSFSLLDDYVCKGTVGNCNTSGGVTGNRDVLDFPLFFRLRDELNGSGLGSWHNIVNASFDAAFDGNANNGSFGVQFVQSHDNFGPSAEALAYAYLLMRTGSPIVYFRAEEFGQPSFPKASRGDPLGGPQGQTITRLVDVHNEYARGDYLERWIDSDLLVFERSNSCLVGLNDRGDNGYDSRTVVTAFPQGQRLRELTGNAADATVDPNNDIFDTVTVGAGGQVTVRVPRARNASGVWHGRSYVIYGPANPDGDLTVSPVAAVIPADPPSEPDATRRLAEIEVVQADSFEVRLETVDADPLDPDEDDLAMLRLDAGMDVNGNGAVDSLDPAFTGYGYENFLTEAVSLESGGVDVGGGVFRGRYRQIIDATGLSEGRHYLGVIAFRKRPGGTPPIFETWRKVILIDRVGPAMELASPPPGTALTVSAYPFVVRSPDRTADRVHVFIDQPPGTDVVALAEGGQNPATAYDRGEFQRLFGGLTAGHHRLDVVAYEPTRAVPRVSTLTGIKVVLNGFDGLGDTNGDGKVTNRDIFAFVQMVQAGNQFSPAADMNGDGLVNGDDVPLFAQRLLQAGGGQAAADALLRMVAAFEGPPAGGVPADGDPEATHG